ncbi:MAG TPA: flagellar protein FlaG [Pseudogulbenkiania sp.]|nr:flagellar protein FlaG [Pseudogulbenkiania sp.]
MQISPLPASLVVTPDSRVPDNTEQLAGQQPSATSVESRRAVAPTADNSSGSASKSASDQSKQPSQEEVKASLEKLNTAVSSFNTDLQFTTDSKDSDVRVVKVIDRNTKEVVRQIPSEEAVRLAKAMDRLHGLLVRDKA